jgi:hypothetical protein
VLSRPSHDVIYFSRAIVGFKVLEGETQPIGSGRGICRASRVGEPSGPFVGTVEVADDYQKYSLCLIGHHVPLSLWPSAALLPRTESLN